MIFESPSYFYYYFVQIKVKNIRPGKMLEQFVIFLNEKGKAIVYRKSMNQICHYQLKSPGSAVNPHYR